MPSPVDVLAFGPHPDDVELCAGGWMLRLADEGRRTAIVDVTRGEAATRGTPEIRAAEAARAGALMRIEGRENLQLVDGAVEPTPEATRCVVEAIRRWQPRVVLGPSREDLHPDHVATAALLDRAYYLSTIAGYDAGGLPPHRPDVLLRYYGHKEPTPSFVVDVSDVWERRVELVRCYASQYAGTDGQAPTNIASPDFFRRMDARFAYWGSRIGACHGEPFQVDRVIPLDDPTRVFRKRGWAVL